MLKKAFFNYNAPARVRAVVVEDDAFVAAAITAKLERRNIEVIWFDGFVAARDYLSRQAADFAILDIGLPDGNGLDLIGVIRQSPLNKEMPVVIATSNTSDSLLIEALGPQRAMFVSQKPIDWNRLQLVLDGTVLS